MKEEGEYEWVSNKQGAESAEGNASSGIYESGSLLLEGEPLLEGELHGASGDECGDGGYCKGHWVKKSGKGHYRGEPIGENPREEAEIGVCVCVWGRGPLVRWPMYLRALRRRAHTLYLHADRRHV